MNLNLKIVQKGSDKIHRLAFACITEAMKTSPIPALKLYSISPPHIVEHNRSLKSMIRRMGAKTISS